MASLCILLACLLMPLAADACIATQNLDNGGSGAQGAQAATTTPATTTTATTISAPTTTTTTMMTTTTTPLNPCAICQNIYRPGCIPAMPGSGTCQGYNEALVLMTLTPAIPLPPIPPMCALAMTCVPPAVLWGRDALTTITAPVGAGGALCDDTVGTWRFGLLQITDFACRNP